MRETGTTIWLDRETRQRVEAAKEHPRETSDDVVRRALDALEAREQRKDERQGSRAS